MSEQVLTSSGIRPATSQAAAAPAHINIPFKEALLVALAAGLGYGFDAYAVNIFGMLGPTLAHDLNISVQMIGLIGSIFLVGYTIGTIGFGFLADRIGRRDALGWFIILILPSIQTCISARSRRGPCFWSGAGRGSLLFKPAIQCTAAMSTWQKSLSRCRTACSSIKCS